MAEDPKTEEGDWLDELTGDKSGFAAYRELMAKDPAMLVLKAWADQAPPPPKCRHRDGEEDCSALCLALWGERFYTEMVDMPEIGQHPADWQQVPGSVHKQTTDVPLTVVKGRVELDGQWHEVELMVPADLFRDPNARYSLPKDPT